MEDLTTYVLLHCTGNPLKDSPIFEIRYNLQTRKSQETLQDRRKESTVSFAASYKLPLQILFGTKRASWKRESR
jgi:hypothetical protein